MIVRILRISLVVAITIADCRAAWSWGMSGRDSAWKLRMSLRGHDFGDNVLDDAPNNRVIAHVTLIVVAQTTTVNIHPKITAAPAIKEKLGSTEWDGVHEEIRRRKRNDETCAKDYQLCPKSLGGGCCPNDRVCGDTGCLPLPATTVLACGKEGYIACGLENGGGCCPSNHTCGRNGCTPLPGAVSSLTCGPNSYLCPAAFNYGCCALGMGCGIDQCYSTGISSFTITQTITTTDLNANEWTYTTTITSATTPVAPQATAPRVVDGIVPKISSSPTSIPKTDTLPKSSSGLSHAQLGGIIGGAVGLLLALLIATYFIIRRLNQAIKVSSAKSQSRSRGSEDPRPKPRPKLRQQDIDAMSVDPLIISPTITEIGGTPKFPSSHDSPYEADSSPVFRNSFSPRDLPFGTHQRGYNAVSTSDGTPPQGWHRHGSIESNSTLQQSQGGYFDIPTQDAQRPSHGRQWSNASEQSAQSHEMVELEAGADGDRRLSFQRAVQGMGRLVSRRRSESLNSPALMEGQPQEHTRSDWTVSPVYQSPGVGQRAPLGHSLGFISEAGESRVAVQGHADAAYTRRDEYG